MSDIEHEVEERRDKIISGRALAHPSAPDFCLNERTRQLVSVRTYARDPREEEIAGEKPMVVMITVPDSLSRQVFSTSDDKIWDWLEDERARRYAPDTVTPFLRAKPKGMFGGVIIEERYDRQVTGYLAVQRIGVIETAVLDKAAYIHNGRVFYHSAAIVGLAWQFLGFCCDFYRTFDQEISFYFALNLRRTAGAMLTGFFPGWIEPTDPYTSAEPCVESGLQFVRHSLRPKMTVEDIAALIRDLATELGNTWGHREARCYAHPNNNPQRPFATEVFRSFTSR